ncbi:MAG: hypothetical protein APR54_11350 [Candidatus Cloacimonas sp. SDB]|nr:MAG: hypothetical protein APR54_11350 [Candidatus Cloacimonas sp. SDB]
MSKKSKILEKKPEVKPAKPKFSLQPYQRNLLTFGLVFILLLILFSSMAFQGLRPGGVDVIGSRGANHQRTEFQQETGETVLWNSPVFSGMPIYHRLGGRVFSADTFIAKTVGKVLYLYIWLYLIGFIGMFYLLRWLKLSYWSAVFGGLAFILIPHFTSLLNIGHFAKFRPIIYMPLVTFLFLAYFNRKNLLWLCGFILAFSVQIRTQHYQIIFYQILILVFIGIYLLIQFARRKEYKTLVGKLLLTAAASVLIVIMVAQPLFVTSEYTPYSIRGGTGEAESTGLSLDYATSWSLHPAEMLIWLMPRFFGGISGELYTGSKVPQLKDRIIPGYWGTMPFTQAYDYVGILIFFLALLGLIFNWKNGLIRTLLILFAVSLFLSFGRHFPLLYNLFFKYVPAFNKFRVPSMISAVMQFIMVIFAGFGLNSLLKFSSENKRKLKKSILVIAAIFILLGTIPFLFSSSFSLQKEGDTQQYNLQQLEVIKTARLDMMQSDGLRLILFTIVIYLVLYLYLNQKLKKSILISLLFILLLLDQVPYVKKAEGELYDLEKMEQTHFRQTDTDKFLERDESYYRVFAITENPFNSNDWSYHHNSIGGYSAAKLRIYQDILENCLYDQRNPRNILNWNIIKMLNNKYIISRQQLNVDKLELVYQDKRAELLVYKTVFDVKPAWFVNTYKVFPERDKRLMALNDIAFDAYSMAILESEPPFAIEQPDSSYVEVAEASFNHISYDIFTDKPSLLVVSEIYYPAGWKCYIDEVETEIFKTDHILRSVFIAEPGTHQVEFRFSPDRFNRLTRIALAGHIILYLVFFILILLHFVKKRRSAAE